VTTSTGALVGRPAQRAQQHRGVVHEAFAVALGSAYSGSMAQKSFQSPFCHMRTTE
jgi:hypothetical protein